MQVMVLEWLAADQPQTYKLMDKQTIRIGRHPECEIVFSDRRISRHHAELYARDGKFQIRTLSQTNIIAVNGLQRLHYNETAPLRAGDVFRVRARGPCWRLRPGVRLTGGGWYPWRWMVPATRVTFRRHQPSPVRRRPPRWCRCAQLDSERARVLQAPARRTAREQTPLRLTATSMTSRIRGCSRSVSSHFCRGVDDRIVCFGEPVKSSAMARHKPRGSAENFGLPPPRRGRRLSHRAPQAGSLQRYPD
jgi:hypothetical protein